MHGRKEVYTQNLDGKTKNSVYLTDQEVEGKMMLKWILNIM